MRSYVRSSSTSLPKVSHPKGVKRPHTVPSKSSKGLAVDAPANAVKITEKRKQAVKSAYNIARPLKSSGKAFASQNSSERGEALRHGGKSDMVNSVFEQEDEGDIVESPILISFDYYDTDSGYDKGSDAADPANELEPCQSALTSLTQAGSLQDSRSTNDSVNDEVNSSDYDTDLEEVCIPHTPMAFDRTGRDVYIEQCKVLDLVPVTRFAAMLGDKSIKMRHYGFGSAGACAIAKALVKNTYVEVLDLTGNGILTSGGVAFADMLHENTFIMDLTLSENSLSPCAGIALAQALQHNTSLKRLVLSGNGFNDKVAKAFAEALKQNCTLRELDLSYNRIGEQGGLYLGAGLACNYGLQTLRLRWNGITAKGGVSIANCLRRNESLTSLDLSWNGLSYLACLAFGTHLAKNETLKQLDLTNNRIGPDGAAKIAPAIAAHPGIESFRIGLNPIGDAGVLHILKSVQKNSSIKLVGLEDITVSAGTHQTIMELENSREITIIIGGLGGYSKGKPPPSGISVLVQFIQDHRMRLKELFFQWDKDQSGDISKHEFERGLLETGLKMEKYQLHALVDQLDLNGDGLVSFDEIVAGRAAELLGRRFERKVAVRTEQREMESIRLPRLKGF